MKIALVVDDSLDSSDGVQQILLHIGAFLTGRGHEVHFLTSRAERTDVRVHSLASVLRLPFNGNRIGIPLPGRRREITKVLAGERFDLVHIAIPYSPLLAGRIIRALPPTTALVGTFMILPLGRLSRWGGKVLGLWQRRQARRFHALTALSAPADEFCRFMYGRPALPIGSPVHLQPFRRARADAIARAQAAATDQPVQILFLGRLVERKGATALITATALLRELTEVPFHVQIAGTGPGERELRELTRSRGLTDRVSFTGYVPEEDKAALLASADIITLPSLGGESFGISVVEALAAGRGATLVGDNPGYASTVGDLRDCLIDPTDAPAFARRLAELIEDPAQRERMSAAQVQRAEDFAHDVVGEKILRVYDAAINSSAAPTP